MTLLIAASVGGGPHSKGWAIYSTPEGDATIRLRDVIGILGDDDAEATLVLSNGSEIDVRQTVHEVWNDIMQLGQALHQPEVPE